MRKPVSVSQASGEKVSRRALMLSIVTAPVALPVARSVASVATYDASQVTLLIGGVPITPYDGAQSDFFFGAARAAGKTPRL